MNKRTVTVSNCTVTIEQFSLPYNFTLITPKRYWCCLPYKYTLKNPLLWISAQLCANSSGGLLTSVEVRSGSGSAWSEGFLRILIQPEKKLLSPCDWKKGCEERRTTLFSKSEAIRHCLYDCAYNINPKTSISFQRIAWHRDWKSFLLEKKEIITKCLCWLKWKRQN